MAENKFNLHHQYKLYLERVSLSDHQMMPIQRQETKRAFFGACGQMLFLLRDDISKMPIAAGRRIYDYLIQQVLNYWQNQAELHEQANPHLVADLELPSHETCETLLEMNMGTPLHRFIYEHEPAGEEDSRSFRDGLKAVIKFAKSQNSKP